MEGMSFNQRGDISLKGGNLKLVDKFIYLGGSVSSNKKDINRRLVKEWTAIDRLLDIWKSDLVDKIKRSFSKHRSSRYCHVDALYGMEKKFDSNYTRMLREILTKSLRQHPTKQQLYIHLPPITKTIKVRQTRHVGHCWRSGTFLENS